MGEKIYVAVFRDTAQPSGRLNNANRRYFRFVVGPAEQLAELQPHRIIKIPKRFADELEKHLGSQPQYLGFIDYTLQKKAKKTVGISAHYRPKDRLDILSKKQPQLKKANPGLASYLEAIAVHALKKEGVTHVRTTLIPSIARARQVTRAGLPVFAEVPVREWLKGLGFDASGKSRPVCPWLLAIHEIGPQVRFRWGDKKWVKPRQKMA